MRYLRAGVLALGLLLGLAALLRTASVRPSADVQTAKSVQTAQQDERARLFPSLDGSQITAILIKTPDSQFEFHVSSTGKVSVNGRRADAEIYHTLVGQIVRLPVLPREPFSGGHDLLLTLTVDAGGAQHTACFYGDGGTGEEAYILCGSQEEPSYWQTDGWRVGTLMMTCEGTRIQDERGNETPAS